MSSKIWLAAYPPGVPAEIDPNRYASIAHMAEASFAEFAARTAYVQLRFSPLLLAATTLGMALTWLVPPAAALFADGPARLAGLIAWVLLAGSYLPTLRRFGRSAAWAPLLPLIAAFYMAATIGSAFNHHFGRGVSWKGRAYEGEGR